MWQGSPKFFKINKNTQIFTKWVAVARKSLLITDFCIIFRDTADGDVFGQKSKLIKKVSLLTPNIPEAEILSGIKIKKKEDMIYAGRKLLNMGVKNVLIKGGHLLSNKLEDQ